MAFQIPQVPQAAAKHYADNAWHMGGIKPILDNTTLRFATDFANVCIRDATALCYQYAKQQLLAEIRELKKQKAVDAEATPVAQPQAIQKSSIILTD
jgi:hypothetical protein